MYDFFLKINSNKSFNPYGDNYYFEKRDTESVNIKNDWYQLYGQSFDVNHSLLVKNNFIIWIYGNIFFREGFSKNSSYESIIENLLSDLNADENIHSKYKGNYCIFCIQINNKSLKIVNSQLGLSHIYYYKDSNEFYVSNNLNHFKSLNLKYNISAVYQKLLFSYVISDDTYFSGVKRINPGEIVNFKNNCITKSIGYGINNIFEYTNVEKFNVEKYISLFNNSVREKANYGKNTNVSFTGGFDGRTIISSLLYQGIPCNAYSFGKINGENTRIPLKISKKIGINYNPVYLEEEYEKHYVEDAKKVIYFSDGMSYNERANYIYAFRKLAGNSRYILSGLIGGETLRPIHLRTDYMNENYYEMMYLNNLTLIDDFKIRNYFNKILNSYDENSIVELKELIFEKQKRISSFRKTKNGFLYYLNDLMHTGFRMYYGTEIHFERQFCNNLTPFYDVDLLDYLFSTDYVNVFKQAFKSGKIHRWSGQKIYAKIISKNYKELNKYPVDRGYPPGYLLNPLKLVLIPYLYYRRKKNRINYIDFDESKWSRLFLKDFLNNNYKNDIVFDTASLKKQTEHNLKNNIHSSDFNRILSLHTWLNQ